MSALPITIQAKVAPEAISKASRFYNASIYDILLELFQNSRRANASQILVQIYDDKLIIEDNGDGIANPQTLLSFGESNWEGDKAEREDAAGMGFYALSNYTAKISSIAKGQSSGWSATLTPEAFQGKTPVAISTSSITEGTRIIIEMTSSYSLDSDIERLARYLPIPVGIVNFSELGFSSRAIQPSDFLEDAVLISKTPFGRIGIVPNRHYNYKSPTVNFHGCTIAPSTPKRGKYVVYYDIETTNGIELVLPARKEIISNSQWADAKTLGLKLLYEQISYDDTHMLSFKEYTEAREMGVDMPPARTFLAKWKPLVADWNNNYGGAMTDITKCPMPIVFQTEPEANIQQLIDMALENSEDWKPSLFDADTSMIGYDWYDSLEKVTSVSFEITEGSTTAQMIDFEYGTVRLSDTLDIKPCHEIFNTPDKIDVILTFASGKEQRLELEMISMGEGYDVSNIQVYMTEVGKRMHNPDTIAEHFLQAYFNPSDDSGSDSYQTQQENFEGNALNAARRLFHSSIDARKLAIHDLVSEDILWRCPEGYEVSITIKNREIDVTLIKSDNPDAED